ncbi:cytochrome b/b6 domain-containing protein [Pseudooctadecabacter jejudonensis]|uniref:Lipid/polyisoprenoid-binding YceI-like domain-containing protein n=1 Tax=Pseudooctadecabacter jejudonensis TaxID=1391910 RepID=A0A1Y5SJ90_9RHOB|nr:cytochrome b/b6 domain-containing protein [Pseudooctadecabacter jejudonensis]SLN42068.1 hypothetical protein PSJ8397_02129 [Pseudooctadecabacter jejudonensis]
MITNTATRYGSLARGLHWIIAALIIAAMILGQIGKRTEPTAENIGFLTTLYSTHKTIGITVLTLAVVRVIWALTQPRPVPLHPERRAETFAAETAHWILYGALFALPLSGWVMHAAEDGFAPIWWPFGQNLPFVPKSDHWAEVAGTVHWAAGLTLGITLAAHIAGALKHALVDRDSTLARMWRGTQAGDRQAHAPHVASAFAGAVIWVGVLGLTLASFGGPPSGQAGTGQVAETSSGGWVAEAIDLTFTIQQLGSATDGRFETVMADIAYDADTGAGDVTVTIDMTSVALGSVTDQAKGSDFFDVDTHPTAVFEAAITRTDGVTHVADGTLTLTGAVVPVTMPFTLTLEDGLAEMVGSVTLDRRDFGIGESYGDESSVGFAVIVNVALSAAKG